ncbi:hypothetical protein HNQ99_002601 [Rhizorhapis suberifaciens]|uniref:Uncharacterized protein n=1 Tax=Rhizorhapis suberifaciens TaxID=13656 RepID=A0A840HXV1_9SPHN|nr:hypothetical protein [Rhizorhapis suberifaciens]
MNARTRCQGGDEQSSRSARVEMARALFHLAFCWPLEILQIENISTSSDSHFGIGRS